MLFRSVSQSRYRPVDTLAREAMNDKKQYMQDLGAKLLDSSAVNKTATQINSEDATNHSVLSLCVSNLNEAMEYCLKWCAAFYGSGSNARFAIKQDFARGRISLEDLKFYQRGRVDLPFIQVPATGLISSRVNHDERKTNKTKENKQKQNKNNTGYRDWETDRKSTRLNSSHSAKSRMPSSA